MSRELFNFIWVPGRKGNTIHVGADVDRVDAQVQRTKDAVILFPSLFTPEVYVEGRMVKSVDVLLASKQEITPQDVNHHLKISIGLDPEKAYDPRPLFASLGTDDIVVEKTEANGDGILHTHHRFSGILVEQVESIYAPYANRYKIKIAVSAIRRIRPEHMEKLSSRATVFGLENAIVGDQPDDVTISKFLDNAGSHGGAPGQVPGHRRYAFKVKSDDTLDLSAANPEEPVQSYHPLFVWSEGLQVANFGHVSDIHLNSRLDILRRSPACVVEDPANLSPAIGTRIVDTNDSFASVLSKMRSDPTVNALIVGGDLIDHIRNTYQSAVLADARQTIDAIWTAVSLEGDDMHDRYPAGVDYLSFYTLIVDFCRRSNKPVFGISGNHDAYEEPFGISPRVFGERGNAGIPADLNLTFYEAILCFGPTWAELMTTSNFNKDWWVWFYQVFGPFNDFVVRLPLQGVVGLGWGSQEDLLFGGQTEEGSSGHLPRSDDAVTDGQLALLKVQMPKRVLLFTHFTMLSFNDPIPMLDGTRPATGTLGEDVDFFNMGTFESNRSAVVDLVASGAFELNIAGHSHRRGTYQIGPGGSSKSLAITMHDTKTIGGQVSGFRKPVIAVSDSAGPMPRLNVANEFGPWGSDVASGTIATFEVDTGSLSSLGIVAADRPKPRVAVSLDYLDVLGKSSQIFGGAIATNWFAPKDESAAVLGGTAAPFYLLTLPLNAAFLTRTRTKLSSLVLHGAIKGPKNGPALKWLRIDLQRLDALGRAWTVPAASTKDFSDWASAGLETFMRLVFESEDAFLRDHYDWADPWYFEVITARERLDTTARFVLQRPSREAVGSTGPNAKFKEIPDFDWRRNNLPNYAPGGT